jgi:hypothetical protein
MGEGRGDSHDETEHVDHETKARNKITKELVEIRNRRSGDVKQNLLAKKENFVLAAGIIYTVLYTLLIFGMTSGTLGNSTAIDHSASKTFLDIGGECDEITDEPWILIFPNEDEKVFSMYGYNFPSGHGVGTYEMNHLEDGEHEIETWTDSRVWPIPAAGEPDADYLYFAAPFEELEEGHYELNYSITVYNQSNVSTASVVEGGDEISKSVEFELDISKQTFAFLPFVDSEKKHQVRLTDTGARSCWGIQDLGNWGYILIGAELGGGRETAMLTGGAAGIPAWWMAFSSLSLSAISLLIIYPLMYKVYHQDSDDILSRNHISQLVEDSVVKTAKRLNIDIDWELYKIEPRDLSIDIMVPYKNTESTLSDSKDVRAEVLREVLEEFAIFRVFKPVQLTVRTIGVNQAIDFESGVGIGTTAEGEDDDGEQNYTDFFSELHTLSRVEDEVRESLELFFARRPDLKMEAAVVTSDDRVIFVSVIYRPTQRFAFFRFKKTRDEVQTELHRFISKRNADLLGSQELIVKGRNQISTLSDRAGAGRVERDIKNDQRIVAVAKQDGFGGKMLQTKFLGNTLSTVEYMANEKREMINKWGFWGLIVFVWIPFMASGVLVGAMLGLLSRMNFTRVLSATIIGGSIASITWAYTAEGIVKFMHQYKLEAVIPLIIIVFVGAAFLHIRSTKMRRQTELFEDTLLDNFHANIQAKYGEQ